MLTESLTFIYIFVLTIIAVIGFGLIGTWIIIPFRNDIKYWMLATPLAGLLALSLGTITLYTSLVLTLSTSVLLMFIILMTISIITLIHTRPKISKQDIVLLSILAVLVCLLFTYLMNYASIKLGYPGFTFIDGTDHLGYAPVADWLRTHTIRVLPKTSPVLPYQSYPALMFSKDHRFGSFFTLAIISKFTGYSGMFSYDFACTAIICTAILSLSATIARSAIIFILLSAGLSLSILFMLGQEGYFAKLIAYPSIIYITSIFVCTHRPLSILQIALIAMLMCSTATMLPGEATSFIFAVLGCIYVISKIIHNRITPAIAKQTILNDAILVCLFVGIIIATTGMLSLVYQPIYGSMPLGWLKLLPYILGLSWSPNTISYSHHLFIYCILALAIPLFIIITQFKRACDHSTTFIVSPLLILSVLIIFSFIIKNSTSLRFIAYEMAGVFYILMLCGIARLIDTTIIANGTKIKNIQTIILSFSMLVMIGINLGNFNFLRARYASKDTIKSLQYSKKELDRLINVIGKQTVIVNGMTYGIHLVLPILVSISTHTPNLQWSPEAWQTILAYRHWPAPKINTKAHLFLVSYNKNISNNCNLVYKTAQYQLLQCNDNAR